MKVNELRLAAATAVLAIVPAATRAQDAAAGKVVFAQCSACHALDEKNGVGPGLKGVIGRRSGSAPGFHYSRAMTQPASSGMHRH